MSSQAILVIELLMIGLALGHMPNVYEFCSYVLADKEAAYGRTSCDQCQTRAGKRGPVGPVGPKGGKGEQGAEGNCDNSENRVAKLEEKVTTALKMISPSSFEWCFLGMKSRRIADSAITASSEWDPPNSVHSPKFARLDNKPNPVGAWCAGENRVGEWIQVDLASPKRVFGVVTQGRPRSYDQWVQSYKVACGNHTNAMYFLTDGGNQKLFAGNINFESKILNWFPTPRTCRFVRVYPQTWHNHMSMRMDLLGEDCR